MLPNINWYSICWSSELGLFCAMHHHSSNKAVTSPDGIVWTERILPNNDSWLSICWSPELHMFCVVGNNNKILLGIPK